MINIRDVAAAAQVSPATVSRVLNLDRVEYPVRPETRERVLDAIDRLGYRPNDLARALLHRRTNVVGLIVPDISNPYYAEIAHGVEEVAAGSGYRIVLCNTNRSAEKTNAYVDTLVKSRVDGVVIAGGNVDSRFSPDLLSTYGTKLVLIGRHELSYPSVQVDNVGAARTATEYVLELGHRSIAFIGGPFTSHTVQDRLQGYRAALSDRGIGIEDRLVREGDFQEAGGYAAAQAIFKGGIEASAVIAINDRTALGAMAAVTDLGLRIPDDVSLIGFDDVSIASFIRPALTTVAIPSFELGRAAMALLFAEADAGQARAPQMFQATLVVRRSCAPHT